MPLEEEGGRGAADETLTAAQLGQIATPLQLVPVWMPPEPRTISGDCVIHDLGEDVPDRPGCVLLLVGARPSNPETIAAVEQAGQRGFACVVVKARGDDLDDLIHAAQSADLALMLAADDTAWRDVDRLVSALVDAQESGTPSYAQVQPGDLFSLANAIAYSVGGATAIEDVNGRMYAHSNLPHQQIDDIRQQSIMHRVTPTFEGDVNRYIEVRHSDRAVKFTSTYPEYFARLGMPIRAGGELLGLLWVLDGGPPLGEGAEQAIEDAATVAALHLLQIRQQENSQRWQRGEILASLLSGRIGASVASALIGVPVATSATVLAIMTREPEDKSALGVARTIDLVNLYCEAWHPMAFATAVDDTIFALLPAPVAGARARSLEGFARDVVGTVLRTNGVTLRIGIGPVAPTLDGVAESRRLAELTLAALGSDPSSSVGAIEGLRSRVILEQLASRGLLDLDLPGDPLEGILDHDRENNGQYAESLLAYLDAFGDTASAAKSLNIHDNTLRYRIRRLQELFDLDLDDTDTRLVTWLQLRLAAIRE